MAGRQAVYDQVAALYAYPRGDYMAALSRGVALLDLEHEEAAVGLQPLLELSPAHQGQLSLDDTITTWLPALAGRMDFGLEVPGDSIALGRSQPQQAESQSDESELELSVRYWEGAIRVRGREGSTPISGRGFLEMTGYGT